MKTTDLELIKILNETFESEKQALKDLASTGSNRREYGNLDETQLVQLSKKRAEFVLSLFNQ